MQTTTVAQRYQKMAAKRTNYLRIAEKCASFTLPYLFPPNKSDNTQNTIADIAIQYTSAGAEAVNFLGNRLVNVLYPPNRPFFRTKIPSEIKKAQDADETTIENALADIERIATEKFVSTVAREHLLQSCLNLIVGGNVLFLKQKTGSRYFSLHNYVVKRASSNGKLLRLIVKERMEVESVPSEYVQYIPKNKLEQADIDGSGNSSRITLWTECVWSSGANKYIVTQYFDDTAILQNIYTEEELPFMALTWTLVAGEDYGHSYCEDYLGSINSAGILAEAVTQLCQVISRVINLVDPSSELAFNTEQLSNAESGSYLVGRPSDVTQIASNKLADMQAVLSNYDMHVRTIQRVFLQNSAVQRDAERVTAEEIRYMADELETAQGGIYSHLASTWQKAMATLSMMEALEALGDNGKALAASLNIKVLTGIESMSRTIESQSTLRFVNDLRVFATVPDIILKEISVSRAVARLANDSDMQNPSELLKSQEEKEAEAQAMQAQQATMAVQGMQ